MRKRLVTTVAVAVVLAAAVMVYAAVDTARSGATPSLCHSTALSIKAPRTARAGSTIAVKGAEAQTPAHDVKATLQFKRTSASAWTNGASASLANGSYSLKWKAPAKKGAYQLRVRVSHGSASNLSAVKKVTVN